MEHYSTDQSSGQAGPNLKMQISMLDLREIGVETGAVGYLEGVGHQVTRQHLDLFGHKGLPA